MKNCVRIVIGLTAVSWMASISPSARACSLAQPGVFSRTVWPDGTQSVPTNSRLVITYGVVNGGLVVPTFGSDVVLLDSSGAAVPFTMEVTGNEVVVRPDGGLLPDHSYQLADQRTIPCIATTVDGCALTAAPAVFASFTTGPDPDSAAPVFAGIGGVSVGMHRTCAGDSCCGPYDLYDVDLSWGAGSDDVARDVRYNVYRREGSSLMPIVSLEQGTSLSGSRICSGNVGAGLEPGDYVVRAVDWAGNEDTNVAARHLGDPCSSGGGCSVAAPPAPSDGSLWLTLVAMAIVAGGLRRRA